MGKSLVTWFLCLKENWYLISDVRISRILEVLFTFRLPSRLNTWLCQEQRLDRETLSKSSQISRCSPPSPGSRRRSSCRTSWRRSARRRGSTRRPSRRRSGRWPAASRPRPPCSAAWPWWPASPRSCHPRWDERCWNIKTLEVVHQLHHRDIHSINHTFNSAAINIRYPTMGREKYFLLTPPPQFHISKGIMASAIFDESWNGRNKTQ